MNKGKYVFSQLLDFLDRNDFNYHARKYDGDKYVKQFTCYNQLVTLMFGQLLSNAMPNWVYTQYKIKGSESGVAALYKTIQDLADKEESLLPNGWGKLWLGNLVKALDGDWEKTYCRGHILDNSLENGILKFNTDEGCEWGEKTMITD